MVLQLQKVIRKTLTVPLCKSIFRPHLEFQIQAWKPYRKKDMYTYGRIQMRSTNIIPELGDLSYEERLNICCLTTLETMMLRRDQMDVFLSY